MKKIINDPSNVVSEMVDGLVRSYPQYLTQIDGTEAVVRTDKDSMKGKVGLVSGGGSGHEPAHAGYVGQGMLSAAVEATKPMVAKKGRASYLGERSKGHIDPGSQSSGYLFSTMLETKGLIVI